VKYWFPPTLAILALLCASVALAEDFRTVNGKEYKNATISRVEADGIVLKTKSGISKVYFTELPKEVQQRYGYHPEKIAAAVQKRAEESQRRQAESASAAIRARERMEIITALADRSDDKIKAVLTSPQMQKAKNSQEQIAAIKNSDLYKRGYAKHCQKI
jgi:hypothetical protein